MAGYISTVSNGVKSMFTDNNKRLLGTALMGATALCPTAGLAIGVAGLVLGAGKIMSAEKVLHDETATQEEKEQAREEANKGFAAASGSFGIMTPASGGLAILGTAALIDLMDNKTEDDSQILSALQDEETAQEKEEI